MSDIVESTLVQAGQYAGAHGLEGLMNAREFWDAQPYGTRLYYGKGIRDYLHVSVLSTIVDVITESHAEIERLRARVAELEERLSEKEYDRLVRERMEGGR